GCASAGSARARVGGWFPRVVWRLCVPLTQVASPLGDATAELRTAARVPTPAPEHGCSLNRLRPTQHRCCKTPSPGGCVETCVWGVVAGRVETPAAEAVAGGAPGPAVEFVPRSPAWSRSTRRPSSLRPV